MQHATSLANPDYALFYGTDRGNRRSACFDVSLSLDGTTWTPVLSDQASGGTTLEQESFAFPAMAARYIRVTGHGNSDSDWNSLTEVAAITD